MSNVLYFNNVDHFQLPKHLMRVLRDAPAKIKLVTVHLYLHLLYQAQERSAAILGFTDSKVADALGLKSKRMLREARKQLQAYRLVSFERKATGQGGEGYVYTLLHPITWQPLHDINRRGLDFDELTPESIIGYFADRLARVGIAAPAQEDFKMSGRRPDVWFAQCPFCDARGDTKPGILTIRPEAGGEWACGNHRCHAYGKLVGFEQKIGVMQGRNKALDSRAARRQARLTQFFNGVEESGTVGVVDLSSHTTPPASSKSFDIPATRRVPGTPVLGNLRQSAVGEDKEQEPVIMS